MAEFVCQAVADTASKEEARASKVEEEQPLDEQPLDAQFQEEMRRFGLEQVFVSDIASTTG
eukprot:5712209-Prorocentrum_lima.AAC.1